MDLKTVAFIQPRNLVRSWSGHWPIAFDETCPPEAEQLNLATSYVERAAREGARVVVFPELYPGPQDMGKDTFSAKDVAGAMSAIAAAFGVTVIYSGKGDDNRGGTYNQTHVISSEGNLLATYNKCIPATNEQNTPGDAPVIVECEGLRIGLMICWEMWFPEIARTLRLQGADLIVAPTGGILYELTENWRTVLRARALENNCYVGMTVNVFGQEDGLCELAGPEGVVASRKGEGILLADIDLDRMHYMQETDEKIMVPKPYSSVPGLIKALPQSVVDAYSRAARQLASPARMPA